MTSVIVPPVDLAPGMPSRTVTVSATDLTEGGQSLAGQKVTFALSDSLDVVSGGDVIAKTQATIELDANGNGSIRLPVYSDSVKTWCGRDWWVLVNAFGSGKAVRVPAGTSSIALSALPNVRPLRGRELQWAVTGAGVTIVEGSQWDASVTLDGGVLRFNITVPPGGESVFRGAATTSTRYETAAQGVYFIASGTVAEAMGLPVLRTGWLTILTDPTSGSSRRIEFRTNHVNASNPRQTWEIASDGAGSFTNAQWELTDPLPAILNRGLALAGMDYKTAREGIYYIASGSLAESLGMPKRAQGWMRIMHSPQGQKSVEFRQTDIVSSTSLEIWEQTTDHTGAWNRPWHQTYPAPVSATSVVTHRHQMLSDEQYNSVGGVVHTDGATPVALTWDDWPADTRDLVVPMLRARGIRATLALPSRVLSPERAPYLGGEGITWPEIDAWVSEGIFEIANHSATHMGASTPEGLRDEIETSLAELHQQLPSARVRCWIQPSVDYPGFNNGDSLDAWTRTEAGQLILDNHALATGLYRREPGVFSDPRLGRPVQGTGRTWIDSGTSSAQAAISALAGTDRGIIIGAHANRLTMGTGYTTPAQLEAFLDWLVDEQDAGRVRLLTLSEWAWADVRPAVSYVGDGVYQIS